MKALALNLNASSMTMMRFGKFALASSGWIRGVTVVSIGEIISAAKLYSSPFRKIRAVSCVALILQVMRYAIRRRLRDHLYCFSLSLIADHKVDLFLTGTCDITGMPNVIGVVLHSDSG
jgi:hypothetical protein